MNPTFPDLVENEFCRLLTSRNAIERILEALIHKRYPMNVVCVITTINAPTPAMESWQSSFEVIVAPDSRTPVREYEHTPYVLADSAQDCGLSLLPNNHYSRKMLGYLTAASRQANYILDTDDDTFFSGNTSPLAALQLPKRFAISSSDFVNVYSLRTDNRPIWPRGLPLTALTQTSNYLDIEQSTLSPGPSVVQFLINGDTDVDAIHRLVFGVQEVAFSTEWMDVVPTGFFCPFNSQLTLWDVSVLPLMYLPSTVSFRFTDILRGVVAKRILDAQGGVMGFADPIGHQVRNPHDYLRDFELEIPCYLHTETAWEVVGGSLSANVTASANLIEAYAALAEAGITSAEELERVEEWAHACENLAPSNIDL